MLTSRSLPSRADLFADSSQDATVLLGGGGARGLAHLGAMRAIGESGLAVGRYVGVSMGSLMAALCAVERDVQAAGRVAREFLESEQYARLQHRVLRVAGASSSQQETKPGVGGRFRKLMRTQRFLVRTVRQPSLLPTEVLELLVHSLLPDIQIEDLGTPLHLVAVEMRTGERVVMSSGPLRKAVVASMSIPGVFPLVHWQGRRLSDVGVFDSLPCDLARSIAEKAGDQGELIAIDVGRDDSEFAGCRTALQSVLRFQELAERRIRSQQRQIADVLIKAPTGSVAWFDFSEPEKLIEAGYQAGREALQTVCV